MEKNRKGQMKIFISHSSFDIKIATALVDFLVRGIGLDDKLIFCSSVRGHGIPLGVNFNDYILEQLKGYDAQVLSLVSNNYYNSKYCLYELGAAWGVCEHNIIPILLEGMKHGELQDFIRHNQAVVVDNQDDIDKLADVFKLDDNYEKRKVSQAIYAKERDLFLSVAKSTKTEVAPKKPIDIVLPDLKYKAIAFDFDGTILQGNNFKYSWKEVWAHLNYNDKFRRTLWDKHRKNPSKYTFQDWCNECAEYFIKRGFKKSHVSEIIEKRSLRLAKGFDTTISLLKDFGFKIAIISGGIDTFLEETIPENTFVLFDKIFVNEFIYDKHGNLEKVKASQDRESDSTGKVTALIEFCKQCKCDLNEVVYVGEGTNDCDVAMMAGLSFSFPAQNAAKDYNDLSNVHPVFEENIAALLSKILLSK